MLKIEKFQSGLVPNWCKAIAILNCGVRLAEIMAKPIPILLQTTIPISFLDVTRLLSNALCCPELTVPLPCETLRQRRSKLRTASRKQVSSICQ
jgi:hypothetical protein